MHKRRQITYKVLLVFPGFGEGRENAEEILEAALHHLNTQKDEPGMRFAQEVSAQLDIVPDAEQARVKLETDDDLAMMILYDLPEDEQAALTEESVAKQVPVCHALGGPEEPRPRRRRSRSRDRVLEVVIRDRSESSGPPAHRIYGSVLTAPLDGDQEELMDRLAQLITVMALGVMEHHWRRNPPKFPYAD